jgi:hypothetical protein
MTSISLLLSSLTTLSLFSSENILPYIKSKAEAKCLLTLNIIGLQLESLIKSLILCLQHDQYLQELINTIKNNNVSNNIDIISLLSLLLNGSILIKQKISEQLNLIKLLLERLKNVGLSIRQYGEQHHAVWNELVTTGLVELANQKKKLAKAELGLYDRVQTIIKLATEKMTNEVYEKLSKYEDIVRYYYLLLLLLLLSLIFIIIYVLIKY